MPRTLRRNVTRSQEPVNDIDTQEESAPRGRRRTAADDKPARGRRGSDDSDDAPARPKAVAASGWDGYADNRQEYGDYAPDFGKTLKEASEAGDKVIIKFVDPAPFAVYKQHWIEENKGKKSFNCPKSLQISKDCPLCDELGDRPATKVSLNVISLDNPEEPRVEVWNVGQKIADLIKDMAKEKRTSPLNRADLYFAVGRTGKKGGGVQTNIEAVKERDLGDDWDIDPLTEEELAAFDEQAYDVESAVDVSTVKQLDAIVDALS